MVMIAGVVTGIWAIIIFSTPFFDNMDLKDKVVGAYNESDRYPDADLKKLVKSYSDAIGEHDQDDGYGNIRSAPGLGLTDDNITIERDDVARRIHFHLEYDRKVVLKPFGKAIYRHMMVDKEGPIPVR